MKDHGDLDGMMVVLYSDDTDCDGGCAAAAAVDAVAALTTIMRGY